MGYMPGGGKILTEILDASAELEELELPNGEFVARIGKAYKIALSIAAVICFVIGIPLVLRWKEDVGYIFLVFGTLSLLVLPSILSYRCKISLREECLVLFFRVKKEVLWDTVKYRKISSGNSSSLTLYDENKKRLISFDSGTVGYGRIVKMSKRSSIRKL